MKPTPLKLTALGAVIALAAGLTACGTADQATDGGGTGSGAPATLSTEPVTLSLYWWGADARIQRTEQVIDLFEQKYPNITVEPIYSDWTSYWEKLATMVAGGNTPDVIQMDQLYLASYSQRGIVSDLSQYPQIDLTTMPDSVLGTGQWEGTLYGLPISTTGLGLLVNLDLLDKYGIAMPDDTAWTWDEFADWAKSISDASGGAVQGAGPMYIEFQLQLFARQLGDQLFADGDIAIKPDTLAKFFQTSLDWVKSGAAPSASEVAETINVTLDQSDFATGKAATIFTPSTQITGYASAMTDPNLKLAEMPHFADSPDAWEYLKPGMYWSMSSKCAHPAEAALLMDFFVNDPDAAQILGTERGIPSSTTVLDAIRPNLTATETEAVRFAESLDLGPAPAIVPNGASDIQAIIQRYMLTVLAEEQTPAEAADSLIAEVKASIQSAQ